MNIIYAETDLGQIRDAREKALVAVPGTRVEECKEVIRYVVLLGLSMEGGYLVLRNGCISLCFHKCCNISFVMPDYSA